MRRPPKQHRVEIRDFLATHLTQTIADLDEKAASAGLGLLPECSSANAPVGPQVSFPLRLLFAS